MTLTTERLKQITDAISAEPHDYESIYDSIKHGEIAAMARELLANREAQPVGKAEITKIAAELVRGDYLSNLWTEAEKSRHVDTHRLQNLLDELHDVMKVRAIAITRLLTAPPAPAVPEDYFGKLVEKARASADKAMRKFPQPNYVLNKVAGESGEVIKAVIHYTEGREEWANVEGEIIDNIAMLIRLVVEGDQIIGFTPPDACRAAMLAQPVSQGYTLPPHVFRELVNSLRDTAVKYQGTQQLREQLIRTLKENGLSAAAPERND